MRIADFLLVVEDAVHRADRAEVASLVQQGRIDFGRGLIDERFAVEHFLPLLVAQLTMRKAYAFRTVKAIEIALYHQLGALPEQEFTHEFW